MLCRFHADGESIEWGVRFPGALIDMTLRNRDEVVRSENSENAFCNLIMIL